jgi:cation-transporting ATPase 13A3/4/5
VSATQETVEVLPENFTTPLLSKSFLFSGTKILKMKSYNEEPVIAMAVKTGFNTTKGSLVRSMLFPKPIGFKFYEDSFKYIGFMTFIAFIGFIYSTYNFIKLGLPKRVMILRALDIITIVVPPALPATLTIGTTFAINRLKQMDIFCISPTRVNVGGKLDMICFDKTGTLTEDGLDVLGVHVATNATGRQQIIFNDMITNVDEIQIENNVNHHELNNGKFMLSGMTACHSLRLIDDELLGDPLDAKMFEFTSYKFKEDFQSGKAVVYSRDESITIDKEFEFVSSLRRMSVLTSSNSSERFLFTKGAPEVMYDICLPESIPSNFDELLHHYTHGGLRVIACAYKPIDDIDISREEAESNLIFTGFIVFENKLKPSTKSTLHHLREAAIRTVMCTGDNILTAISVGRDCGLIDQDASIFVPSFAEDETHPNRLVWQNVNNSDSKLDCVTLTPLDGNIRQVSNFKLAITGDVFRYILTEIKDTTLTQNVLMNCDIFARMSPDEKHELVEQLQKIDYTVGFCGDGANDCGALKAADVGISLSEAEASVAAPFTSSKFEISCVLDVIKEGRSSLVTSFSCFKYMSLYSAIQFVTVSILYKRGTNLGDFQFLYIDLFLILPLAIFMSWSKPFERLVTKRPTANLVSPKILIPMVCHILIILIFQIILWLWVQDEPWYQKPVPGGDDAVKSSDNTVLFLFTNFQYILISVILSAGPPYRESMIKNHPYSFNLVVAVLLSLSLFLIKDDSKLGDLMQLTNLTKSFYGYIVLLSIVNFGVMFLGEEYIFSRLAQIYKRIFHRLSFRKSKKLFKNLKKEFNMIQSV